MIPLPRDKCVAAIGRHEPIFTATPIQLGMDGDAWRVTVCSVLLCRTRRVVAENVIAQVLTRWPTPGDLARAEVDLETTLRPLGFQRNRAQRLRRLSFKWVEGGWEDLRDLPGVGTYVADAVGLICFGCIEIESNDPALLAYLASRRDASQIESDVSIKIE